MLDAAFSESDLKHFAETKESPKWFPPRALTTQSLRQAVPRTSMMMGTRSVGTSFAITSSLSSLFLKVTALDKTYTFSNGQGTSES
jgi:hypothetical protein